MLAVLALVLALVLAQGQLALECNPYRGNFLCNRGRSSLGTQDLVVGDRTYCGHTWDENCRSSSSILDTPGLMLARVLAGMLARGQARVLAGGVCSGEVHIQCLGSPTGSIQGSQAWVLALIHN